MCGFFCGVVGYRCLDVFSGLVILVCVGVGWCVWGNWFGVGKWCCDSWVCWWLCCLFGGDFLVVGLVCVI